MKANVSLCIIVKNDPLLKECIGSIRDFVEEIVIVDTGSTPENQAIARDLADIFEVYTDCNNAETGHIESFSKARQRSFDLATKEFVLWMDSDDVIENGEQLYNFTTLFNKERLAADGIDAVAILFPYEYAFDGTGKCTLKHYRERLLSNKKHFRWVNPVHEVLVGNDGLKVSLISDDSIVWKHKRQFSNKPVESGRNLRILKKFMESEGKDDARQMYYIGLEYHNNGFVPEAIDSLTKYIEMSGWDEEKVMACLKLVDIYQSLGQYQEALKWGFKAIEINEFWAEGYLAIGRMFYFIAQLPGPNQHRNWERCIHFIKVGMSMPLTKTLLFINPMERQLEIYKYLNVAQNAVGDVKGALESVNTGLQSQEDTMLLGNKNLYEKFLATQQIASSVNTLKSIGNLDTKSAELILAMTFNQITADKLLNSISQTIEFKKEIPNDKFDVVFFIGQGVEEWTPETVKKTGIGGSELMAIELSKRLAKQGNRVRVYNSCGISGEGIYDGVEYYQTEKYHSLQCDVLIISRRADMIDAQFNISAKLKLLWVHDIYAINATPDILYKYDRILALSEWHKKCIVTTHNIAASHVLVTRNGIDLNRFKKEIKRDQYKIVCSSSPDRYLPALLDFWVDIKEQVSEASLDIFYGFKNWEFMAQQDPGQLALIESLKSKMEKMRPMGVRFRDRVSQEQLAEEFLSAGVWAYSTWFSETSCISAMEAQAAGLRLVTSPIAALNETVGSRGTLVVGDWTSPEYKDYFIDGVVSALQNNDNSDRKLLQEYAEKNFDLDSLSMDWENMFSSIIKEMQNNPIVPFINT